MIERLLIVPDSLANASFQGCVVISSLGLETGNHNSSPWPRLGALQRLLAEHASSGVAVTSESNPQVVQRLVAALRRAPQDSAAKIVFADDAIPSDLRSSFPAVLFPFLQRILPRDLIEVSTAVIQNSAATESLLASALQSNFTTTAVEELSPSDRFPEAGPADFGANQGLSPDRIKVAVDIALAGAGLSAADCKCVAAGVLLLWDFLDESHEISQTMEGRGTPRTADYWHGIMHRREPDAGNASYWFRRVGPHPAFDSLSRHLDHWMRETGASDKETHAADRLINSGGQFDQFRLIELATLALRKPGQLEDSTLRRVQYLEILNLLSTAWQEKPDKDSNK